MAETVKDPAAAAAEAKAAADAAAAADKAAAAGTTDTRVVPESYTLALPEKSLLDPKVTDRLSAFAKANKLTQDEAAAALGLVHAEVGETIKALEAANAPPSKENPLGGTLYQARVKELEAASLKHPQLGNGDPMRLKAVSLTAQLFVAKNVPELTSLLDRSGAGSDPDVLIALNRLATMIAERPHVKDAGPPPEKRPDPSGRDFYAPDGGKKVAEPAAV